MEGIGPDVATARPLVGREAVLRTLVGAIEAERSVVIVGDPGVGKTTLARAGLSASGRRWFEGGGFASLDWLPYVALRNAVGRELDGDPTRVAKEIEATIGPDVLLVDDVQWLDAGSITVLTLLVGRVQLVLTLRTDEGTPADRTTALETLDLETIVLRGLDDDVVRKLATSLRPGLSGPDLDWVVAAAGGIPLIVEELAAAGSVSPLTARGLIARADALPPPAQRLVRLLAVADRPLPRRAMGRGVRAALDQGTAIRRGETIEIRHAVLAAAIRDTIEPRELRRIHATLAQLVDDPAEAARHLLAAGDADAAAAMALAAAAAADGPRESAALLVLAADATAAAMPEDPATVLERRLMAARALDALADWSGVLSVFGKSGDGSVEERSGVHAEAQAEAAALCAHAAYALGRHDDARAWLERSARQPVDETGAAAVRRAWETAAFMVNVDGAVAEGIAYLDSQRSALSVGDTGSRTLAGLRDSLALLAGLPVSTERIQGALDEALESGAYARATDLARVMNVALLMWRGSDSALTFLDSHAPRFEAASASDAAMEFLAEAVQVNVEAGRFTAAVVAADELAERPAPPRATQMAAIFRACALGVLGRLDHADDALDSFHLSLTDDWFGRGEWYAVRAQVALWSGRPAEAGEFVEAALTVPTPLVGGHILPMLTGAWAAVERGVAFEAAASPIRSLAGAAHEFEALTYLAADEPAVAADRFAEAARLWQDFNAVRSLTCGWAQGEALRRAGFPAAGASLLAALDRAEAAAFEPVATRARRSLRLAGVRVAGRPRRPTAMPGLTAREAELLALVGRGQTNIEIARRMGLGRPTVVRILSNAMSKLGATSRAQAVAVAAELDAPVAGGLPGMVSTQARSILALLADGLTLGQAASRLELSRRTADRRLAEARRALGARRTTDAVMRARRAGWFD